MPNPRAYFLTWTCHGTWLHGDGRGSIDRDHNQYGTAPAAPNRNRNTHQQSRLNTTPQTLNHDGRLIVEQTIRDHCGLRNWTLWAINVRTNHVHVIVAAGDVLPMNVMGQLKSWSTRRLREADLVDASQRIWTKGGSSRFLWDDDSVARATQYVVDGQGEELR